MGILVFIVLLKKLDCKIMQDMLAIGREMSKYEDVPGFTNVLYISERVQNKWVIR